MTSHQLLTAAVILGLAGLPRLAAQERWAFEPARDPLTDDALWDLRSMNEETAGQSGRLRLSEDGMGFRLGDGTPCRLWPVTSYAWAPRKEWTLEDMRYHCRSLAKRGVNMVRLHLQIDGHDPDDPDAINRTLLERVHMLAAACKESGIYLTLSPYWANSARKHFPEAWRDELGGENTHGLLFFHPWLQARYKNWIRRFLSAENPHTGLALKDDPVLGIFQVQNEDSLLFWTQRSLTPQQATILGRQYAHWLVEKYGSLDAAYEAWGGVRIEEGKGTGNLGDRPDEGVMAVYIVWEMTQDHTGGMARRLADQTEFFARVMYQWNEEVERFVHEGLGCPVLVNAGNWKTASNEKLLAAERWSYTANEVLAVNRYFGGIHIGPQSGWSVKAGHQFVPRSVIRNPHLLPHNLRQLSESPMLITETTWTVPNPYIAEGPLLSAAYQSLTGVDGTYWFAIGTPTFQEPIGNIFFIGHPCLMGQFPAAALMYRRGDVTEGPPALVEERTLKQVWGRESPVLPEGAGFDPNRDVADTTLGAPAESGVHPLAYLVGRVETRFVEGDPRIKTAELERFIDPRAGRVTSLTGQLVMDYRKGLFTCDSPRAQAAAGFLAQAGPVRLGDVTIDCRNEYASVMVVSLDGEAIAESAKILIQVGTTGLPAGREVKPSKVSRDDETFDGFEITRYGEPPWMVARARLTLEIANDRIRRAVPVDANGYASGEAVPLERAAGRVKVRVPEDTLYVVLQ